MASCLSASVTQKKFVFWQQHYKYAEAIIASEEKIAYLKASLATEKSNKVKVDDVLDSIETQGTSARDGLVSDLAQVSPWSEHAAHAANLLVSQRESAWNILRTIDLLSLHDVYLASSCTN